MKSATSLVVLCVLVFFVMTHAKVENRKKKDSIVAFLNGYCADAPLCKDSLGKKDFPYCQCLDVAFPRGHYCYCFNHRI
ncbi:predicted protein [Arabidopsis lyrata subsp. lyrata]|uniref:Predicted protein n=1 Tax=Arabidopsis lyrata subsp. lyrata TaxID=81972 RepID=D7L992_ARALL|nr:predicted protein [Arabidopsis lyrata subsp. lyrata]